MRFVIFTITELSIAFACIFFTSVSVLALSTGEISQLCRIAWFVSCGAVAVFLFILGSITGHEGNGEHRTRADDVPIWDDRLQEWLRHADYWLAIGLAIVATTNFAVFGYGNHALNYAHMVMAMVSSIWLLGFVMLAFKIKNPPEMRKIARAEPRVMHNLTHRPWLFSRTHKPGVQPWIFSRSHQPRAWEQQQPAQPWDFTQINDDR